MNGNPDPAARFRRWLRWLIYGDLSLDWLRPRRALVPSLMAASLVVVALLHEPGGYYSTCATAPDCLGVLTRMADEEPIVLTGAVGLHGVAVALAYAISINATRLVERWVNLEAVAPRLFAPDDQTLVAVLVAWLAALLAYFAGAYMMAYSLAGLAILYVLYFPALVVLASLEAVGKPPEPLSMALVVLAVVAVPILETLWLYGLAHGAIRAIRRDEP